MSLSRSASICSDTARIESSPSDRADGSAALVRGENQLRVRPYLPIYERFVGPGVLDTAASHDPCVVRVSAGTPKGRWGCARYQLPPPRHLAPVTLRFRYPLGASPAVPPVRAFCDMARDRKSTRLNSSHQIISY